MPTIDFDLPTTESPDAPVSLKSLRGKVVLVLGESQQTSAANAAFHERMAREALTDAGLREHVRAVPVVNLSVVPKPLQPMVLEFCKAAAAKITFPVWLDWDGSVSTKTLGFTQSASSYLLLLSPAGEYVWGHKGVMGPAQIDTLLAKTRALVAGLAPAPPVES